MPRNGSGNYSPPVGYEAVANETIESAKYNALVEDVTNALNDTVLQSGLKPMTGNLAMGDNKITGLADGTADTDAATKGQVDTELATKQPLDAGLTSISGLTTSANQMIYTTGSDAYATTALSAFGRNLLDDADASAALTTLGVSAFAATILDDADAATARATLGLGSIATEDSEDFISSANNLSDLASAATARSNLGLGTAAVLDDGEGDAATLGGIAASNYARTDEAETFVGTVTIESEAPILQFKETTDTNGAWVFVADGNTFSLRYPGVGGSYPFNALTDGSGNITDVQTMGHTTWHAGNFAKPVFSGQISVPASGSSASWAHGLGAVPDLFGAHIVCVTTEHGFAVGDKISLAKDDGDGGRHSTVYATSTTVEISKLSSFGVMSPAGSFVTLTDANWRVVFWAQDI